MSSGKGLWEMQYQRVMGNAVYDKVDDQGKRPLVKTQGTQTRHCDTISYLKHVNITAKRHLI